MLMQPKGRSFNANAEPRLQFCPKGDVALQIQEPGLKFYKG